MAGLYLHIPFCKSRCVYCGFYSTTSLNSRQQYVEALCMEMELRPLATHSRKEETNGTREVMETIYLGGGTPSQLTVQQLERLFVSIYKIYNVSPQAEVTIECNPDDVSPAFAEAIGQLPVNRVSMGAQTFQEQRLRFLRRRHTAEQVGQAVERLRQAGLRNISIDLIYGFPNETMEEWKQDVDRALSMEVEHLSAYALSYEEGTPLFQMLERGQVEELDEELQRDMYYYLKDKLQQAGYEHYEISNFAKPGYRSRHNSSYWNHTPYIGLGAGAHSFDGLNRSWNTADLNAYMDAISQGRVPADSETLDEVTLYNDIVMTALRTCEGLDMSRLATDEQRYCLSEARKYLSCGWLQQEGHHLRLTRQGLFVSDRVMADLMK